MHKAVVGHVEAEELLSRCRQSDYSKSNSGPKYLTKKLPVMLDQKKEKEKKKETLFSQFLFSNYSFLSI